MLKHKWNPGNTGWTENDRKTGMWTFFDQKPQPKFLFKISQYWIRDQSGQILMWMFSPKNRLICTKNLSIRTRLEYWWNIIWCDRNPVISRGILLTFGRNGRSRSRRQKWNLKDSKNLRLRSLRLEEFSRTQIKKKSAHFVICLLLNLELLLICYCWLKFSSYHARFDKFNHTSYANILIKNFNSTIYFLLAPGGLIFIALMKWFTSGSSHLSHWLLFTLLISVSRHFNLSSSFDLIIIVVLKILM